MNVNETVKFIDLFAGIGGIRKGFEEACEDFGLNPICVFTSEIKESAISVLHQNHPYEEIWGDITSIDPFCIPNFDFLLAGFPCQPFSAAGKRLGFEDTRGTLFFDVARILHAKKPRGFILENVEGLVNHKKGKTLETILNVLKDLGYQVDYKVLNAVDFGVPQKRKRIYIVGTLDEKPSLDNFVPYRVTLSSVLEKGKPVVKSYFTSLLLENYSLEQLKGKKIKDKRGGRGNIHSWDIGYKGPVSSQEKKLLNALLTNRRQKHWASEIGIQWMDGMPLTTKQISTFFKEPNLQEMLDDLEKKGYLTLEHPKQKVGNKRIPDPSLPKGYNIVAGKISFEVSEILNPNGVAPTLVAMDMDRLFVVDSKGLRRLTLREGLRLFGYPDDFKFDIPTKEGYDLLGNTVVVPVIKAVAERVLAVYYPKLKVKNEIGIGTFVETEKNS